MVLLHEKISEDVTCCMSFIASKIYHFGLIIGSRKLEMNAIYF